jgi:hypothetical protein
VYGEEETIKYLFNTFYMIWGPVEMKSQKNRKSMYSYVKFNEEVDIMKKYDYTKLVYLMVINRRKSARPICLYSFLESRKYKAGLSFEYRVNIFHIRKLMNKVKKIIPSYYDLL